MAVLTVGAGQTYTTIQAAINAAADGDEIQIKPGITANRSSSTRASLLLARAATALLSRHRIRRQNRPFRLSSQPIAIQLSMCGMSIPPRPCSSRISRWMAAPRHRSPRISSALPCKTSIPRFLACISRVFTRRLEAIADIQGIAPVLGFCRRGWAWQRSALQDHDQGLAHREFQKTGIVAWGNSLNAIIQDNQIVGAAELGKAVQNGMQIGSAGLREGGRSPRLLAIRSPIWAWFLSLTLPMPSCCSIPAFLKLPTTRLLLPLAIWMARQG